MPLRYQICYRENDRAHRFHRGASCEGPRDYVMSRIRALDDECPGQHHWFEIVPVDAPDKPIGWHEEGGGMEPLYRLPNGDWIELLDVRRVLFQAGRIEIRLTQSASPPRVVVVFADGTQLNLNFDEDEMAKTACDQIAAAVNTARTGGVAEKE